MSTRIKIELNPDAFGRLVEAGVAECRSAGMQAEVLLLRALGLAPELFTPPGSEPASVIDDPVVEGDARAIA